jgi:hypothetical protein
VSGITAGPAFVSLTKGGKPTGTALQANDVRRIVRDLAKRVGLKPEKGSSFSAHSLREGMAQDLPRRWTARQSYRRPAGRLRRC